MKEKLRTKAGKKDRKLIFLNRKRKKQIKKQELNEKRILEEKEEKKKKEEIVLNEVERKKVDSTTPLVLEKEIQKEIVYTENKKDIISKVSYPTTETIQKENNDNISIFDKKNKLPSNEKEKNKEETKFVSQDNIQAKNHLQTKHTSIEKKASSISSKSDFKGKNNSQEEKIVNREDFLEKKVIKILEQDIQEKKFELKKIDSEIYTIQKAIDSTTDKEDLEEIDQEIQKLIEMIEKIKRQILALEKTFDLKFQVEDSDNYLIYLVEEYKNHRKEKKEISKKLQENLEYQSLIDIMIEVEEKKQILEEKVQDKKNQLELDEEQITKLNNDVIDIEKINQKLTKMIENHEKIMDDIKQKVNDTVHITERVEFITKSVNHTMLELFLLMALLKHNLSIKNNAVAAITAAITLDMIIKMTTPIQEKVTIKDNDVKDYSSLIHNCMSDTNFLIQLIENNLNQISSIRYTFEHNYQECSYLASYQDALQKLTILEEEMKERKSDTIKMEKDIELQLEKNNAKVKKYSSMKTA